MPSPRTCSVSLLAPRFIGVGAFSLVEVTIALGIVSLAMLSVMGMMPVGLSTMRAAMDQTTEAQIARRISGEAALIPFDQLDAYAAAGPYFFTQDGTLQSVKNEQTRYTISLRRVSATYPGSSNAPNLSSNIATFLVETARGADNATIASSTNVIHIPNSGNSAF